METLWSISTTIREANRLKGFVKSALDIDGEEWNPETAMKFQSLLIKNREFLNGDDAATYNKLSPEQIEILKDKTREMTYEEARGIFDAKDYQDPPMRGRNSMAPLHKLGLVLHKVINGKRYVFVSEVGKKLVSGEMSLERVLLEAMLKMQLSNPLDGYDGWNTKPFVTLLRLIKKVHVLATSYGMKEQGIRRIELGIFWLSMKNYRDVDVIAHRILTFRKKYESLADDNKKDFVKQVIETYLSGFNNPLKNVDEYSDNVIRYIRPTQLIHKRGKYEHVYIDIEPRRMIEVDSILANDDGSCKSFTNEEDWDTYLGTPGSYVLPYETIAKLQNILKGVNDEIALLEMSLGISLTSCELPSDKASLEHLIEERRNYRLNLQNLKLKEVYRADINKIDETIQVLSDIKNFNRRQVKGRFSVEFESQANKAMSILDDAIQIKPNAVIGDDGEFIFTAGGDQADLECFYEDFCSIVEVTTLRSRDQWVAEGQPVMRHLRNFEKKQDKPAYCLFIAPEVHRDTINTFYTAVKYEFENEKQRIIPMNIPQFQRLLVIAKRMAESGKHVDHHRLKQFYDECLIGFNSSLEWSEHINHTIGIWENEIVHLNMPYEEKGNNPLLSMKAAERNG